MGVISASNVMSDLCFGPIPTALMIADPAYLIGNMTSDVFPEIPPTTVNLSVTMEAQRFIEWVPYLRSARCDEEQNMELVRHRNGDIFYRITKPVPAGRELLIWFSKEYCREISMPTADDVTIDKETNTFKCEQCGTSFKYVLPYICHQTFKCKKNPRSIFINPAPNLEEENKFPIAQKRKVDLRSEDGEGSAFRKVTRISPPICDPMTSSLSRSSTDCLFINPPTVGSNNNNNFLFPESKLSTCNEFTGLGFSLMQSFSFCNPNASHTPSALTPPGAVCSTDFPHQPQPSNILSPYSPFVGPNVSSQVMSPVSNSPSLTTSSQHRLNSFAFSRSNNPMVEKLLQSAISGEALSATPLSPNPLSALNLTQNWCAKCNATFRMTSDLVYHMRTHHKREVDQPDSTRVRRHDKLRCEVCGETFRERHHLTRHMTSHD